MFASSEPHLSMGTDFLPQRNSFQTKASSDKSTVWIWVVCVAFHAVFLVVSKLDNQEVKISGRWVVPSHRLAPRPGVTAAPEQFIWCRVLPSSA